MVKVPLYIHAFSQDPEPAHQGRYLVWRTNGSTSIWAYEGNHKWIENGVVIHPKVLAETAQYWASIPKLHWKGE